MNLFSRFYIRFCFKIKVTGAECSGALLKSNPLFFFGLLGVDDVILPSLSEPDRKLEELSSNFGFLHADSGNPERNS